MRYSEALALVREKALQAVAAQHYNRPCLTDAETPAADELAVAARELVRAVDALPTDLQPAGWTDDREPAR